MNTVNTVEEIFNPFSLLLLKNSFSVFTVRTVAVPVTRRTLVQGTALVLLSLAGWFLLWPSSQSSC